VAIVAGVKPAAAHPSLLLTTRNVPGAGGLVTDLDVTVIRPVVVSFGIRTLSEELVPLSGTTRRRPDAAGKFTTLSDAVSPIWAPWSTR
jgi:hypothetical protein